MMNGHSIVGKLSQNCAITAVLLIASSLVRAELMAGAAKVSITPDQKVFSYQLGGYVSPDRTGHNAVGVHDNCYSRALVLSDGKTKVAIVSLDLCFMPANVKTSVLQHLNGTGISTEGLFLSATHTHSAPDPLAFHSANNMPAGKLSSYDEKLTNWVAEKIAESIQTANSSLKPARAGAAQLDKVGLNRNRRGEMITDDQMTVLKVTDTSGKTVAAILNYAAHPVYFGSEMLQVSGDWAGAYENQIESLNPGAVALFLNGAEGDASANGADVGTSAERITTFSTKMASTTRRLLDTVAMKDDVSIKAWIQETPMPPQKPHPSFILASFLMKATPDQTKDLINRVMPAKIDVCYIQIGDLLLMGVPGEPTTPIGLAAKGAARAKGIKYPAIVALTNGWIGYIVTPEQYKAGKYEPTMSFYGDQVGVKVLEGVRAGLERFK